MILKRYLGNDFNVDQDATLECVLTMHPYSIDDVDGIPAVWVWLGAPWLNLREMTTGVDRIFFKLHKIDGKNYGVIIDSGSCVNVVTSGMVTKLGLKTVP